MRFYVLFLCLILVSCNNSGKHSTETKAKQPTTWSRDFQTISQLGDTLYAAKPSNQLLQEYEARKATYQANPDKLDHLIWYGRFTAYTGDYRGAIAIYSEGLKKYPKESRLLRHRGHRYISLREFDKAVRDLKKAAQLIQGKENMLEEDGMPNAQNIPVSTMHGNIYYHLGLAHYLNRNFPAALEGFKKCLGTSNHPDNVVSATHWIYMIQRRLGRKAAADNYLRNITPSMNVIENTTYYQLCQFYRGIIPMEEIYPVKEDLKATPTNSALKYGIGNYYFYNGNPNKANEIYKEICSGEDWASFGYIAAETDLAKPFSQGR